MFRKNNIYLGMAVALVFPAIALAVANALNTNWYIMNKPALPYYVAIALNLILLRIFYRNNADKTAQGIMLATLVFFILIFLFKAHINR